MAIYAGYRRVSHVGGRDGDRFHSPGDQAQAIERWAQAHGHRVEMLEPELDQSGARADRPILTRAVEEVERGKYAGIVVAYLSRASRDLGQMLALFDRVERAGGSIISVAEGIDSGTTNGAMATGVRNILASIAQMERDLHAERFEERRRAATEAGIWQRRQTPRGYRKDPDTRRLVPDRRTDQIRKAFADFLAGESVIALARRLGMTPSGVRQLLRNRVYLGELKVGQHVNPSAHEPIIDPATFAAVQRRLDQGARPARSKRPPALLAGLVFCQSCGHRLTRGSSSGRATYGCPGNHAGERCPSPAAISCKRLDSYVERIALQELEGVERERAPGKGVEHAEAALRAAQVELDTFLAAVSAADLGPDAFRAAARDRRAKVEQAERELADQLVRQPVAAMVGTGADAWPELGEHDRNALLRALIAAVIVEPAGRGRRVPVEHRARVLRYGATLPIPRRQGGAASGIVPLPWPNPDDPSVIGVAGVQDSR